jgi:hypothetical protein
VLAPGEIELAHEARSRELGITLSAAIAGQLVSLGEELDVAFPSPLAVVASSEPARS